MAKEAIADIFDRMARVLAFKGEDRFRFLAYERAAASLRALDEDLAEIARAGKLDEIPGIGRDLSAMIKEYLETGRIRRYEKESRGVSDELIEMLEIPGLGPKTLSELYRKFRFKNLAGLKRRIAKGDLLKMPGFGPKKVENLRRGIALWEKSRQRRLLGAVLPVAERLILDIRRIKYVERADLAGSIRRRKETIGDIDVVIISKRGGRALAEASRLPIVKQVLALGDTRASLIIEGGIQVDIRAVERESYGAALQYFTGSKKHTLRLRRLAQKRGLKINEYGIFEGERRLGGKDEREFYRLLGLQVMPPELREDRGEIEAAGEKRLPKLVEARELRGDLHAHTTWSDGRASVAEMVEAAAGLGYEYIALTDHSQSARVARGLDLERLEAKIEEVERVRRERRNRKPKILLGAEVDILADGKLDYPDSVLSRLDLVVASLHGSFRQSRERMTGRLLDAIANPYVHVIGHPTTRLIGGREPVEFDFERIIEAAAEAGVALEVNSQPKRLDLPDEMVRAVVDAGALLAIDSDAHSAGQLKQIDFGVFQARRGWVEARQVVNTWPWQKFNRWLLRRRQ